MATNTIKQGQLHIWQYAVNEQDYQDEKTNPILSHEETEKYKRFLHEKDAIKYICNHRFLRQVLASYLDISPKEIKFSYTKLGKPYIKNSNLFFSLSHRNKYGLLAISKDAEVGVDIEYMKDLQDVVTFSNYSFSEEEKALIFTNEKINTETLFTFWTFKEAFIKATGTGLSVDISKINLADFYTNETIAFLYDNNAIWTLKRLQAEESYKAAFAIKGKVDEVLRFEI
ncbi:MAG: 4'-phosphopantetheinyl transferase superfamily protein [Bacteroidia bacterium]